MTSEYKGYKALKSAGKVSIAILDDHFSMTREKYDPTTGEALDDSITSVHMAHITMRLGAVTEQLANMESEKEDLETLKTDLEAL
jgi:hypothetical protein